MTFPFKNQSFTIQHADSGAFEGAGLRPFFEYRDFGINAATKGTYGAHVIRALPFARYLKRGAIALALVSTPAHASDLPSGQTATLHEVLIDTVNDEPWLRFRFVTPAIAREGGTVSYAEAEPDMAHLCDTLALPYIAEHDLQGEVIVISFADRITEFGVPDPEATQFFEAYRVKNKACVWEGL